MDLICGRQGAAINMQRVGMYGLHNILISVRWDLSLLSVRNDRCGVRACELLDTVQGSQGIFILVGFGYLLFLHIAIIISIYHYIYFS